MSLLFVMLSAITGFLILRLAWPNGLRLCRHDVLRASLGAGLGLGIASLIVFLADAAFGGGAKFVLAADLGVFALSFAANWILRRNAACPLCAHPSPGDGGFVLSGAALLSVGAAAAAFCLFIAANPFGEWDAWAIWINHARFLASGPTWTRMFSPSLAWAVQDYPLLVPGAIANAWMAAGTQSQIASWAVSGLFLFGAIGVVFGVLDLLRGRMQALVGVAALLGAGAITRMGASQYADVPLAFFYAAAVAMLCLPDAIPDDRHSWWLAGAMAGCAAWTKNEGLVFLAVIVIARAIAAARSRSFHPPLFALLIAGAAPFALATAWFKHAFAPANYLISERQQPLGALLADVSRYMTVAVEFGRQGFIFGGWLLPPVLVLAVYFWMVGKSAATGPGRLAGLLTTGLMLGAYAGVYVVTTKDLNWQIETSLARVMMQLWPMAVLTFFLYARELKPAAAPEQKQQETGKRAKGKGR